MDNYPRSLSILVLFLSLVLPPAHGARADDYFPLNPGNAWTYRGLDGRLETLVIGGVTEKKGVPLIEASYDGGMTFYYINSEDGIYRLQPHSQTASGVPRGELTLLLQWPLEPGQSWPSPWSDPPLSFTVLDRGPFTVAAGIFRRTLKIGYRPVSSPIYRGYLWFAPGVGLLAQEESGYRIELVSYTLTDLLPPPALSFPEGKLAAAFSLPLKKEGQSAPSTRKRLKGLLFSAPSYLFLLLLALVLLGAGIYLRFHSTEMEMMDSPEVREGETVLASAMVREGLYAEAAEILQRLTARHPQWPDIAALLGNSYRNIGKHREACLELKRALTLNPDMPAARLDLVRTYIDLDNATKAMDEVETVLTDYPGFADARYLKGKILVMMGKEEEARDTFREALAVNPSFREAQMALEKLLEDQKMEKR